MERNIIFSCPKEGSYFLIFETQFKFSFNHDVSWKTAKTTPIFQGEKIPWKWEFWQNLWTGSFCVQIIFCATSNIFIILLEKFKEIFFWKDWNIVYFVDLKVLKSKYFLFFTIFFLMKIILEINFWNLFW